MGLRPVTYSFDVDAIADFLQEDYEVDKNGNRVKVEPRAELVTSRQKKSNKRNTGFVAQEVEKLANRLGYDFSGVEVPENDENMIENP